MMRIGVGKWTFTAEVRPQARMRLLCFVHAGGGASAYSEWTRRLRRDVELVAVQLPGRENRFNEPPVETMTELLDVLVDSLSELEPRPYAVFGHSAGAVLAYGFCHGVQARPNFAAPVRLFASAPAAPRRSEKEDDTRPRVESSDEMFIRRLRDLGGIPSTLFDDPTLTARFLTIFRADVKLARTVPNDPQETSLALPISVFYGLQDPLATEAVVRTWIRLSSGPSMVYGFNGGHFYYQNCPIDFFEMLNATLETHLRGLDQSADPRALSRGWPGTV